MPIFVDESEEKGSKRRIDVELVNKGKNYDPFYPIFQQLSRTIFARFKFLARFFSCTNSCTIVHDKYFDYARNRARKHDKIFFVISNPDLNHLGPKLSSKSAIFRPKIGHFLILNRP